MLFPTLARIGVRASGKLLRWGWYPEGGGRVEISIQGKARLQGIDLTERGKVVGVRGLGVACNLPSHIAHRIAARANNLLADADLPAPIQPIRVRGPSAGAGIFLAMDHESGIVAGFSALGEKGKPSEVVAQESVDVLLAYHRQQNGLDRYLPDQLIPALVLAEGPSTLSTVEITQHTLTTIALVREFISRGIRVGGNDGRPGTIEVSD